MDIIIDIKRLEEIEGGSEEEIPQSTIISQRRCEESIGLGLKELVREVFLSLSVNYYTTDVGRVDGSISMRVQTNQ